jgi:hypothetical protein
MTKYVSRIEEACGEGERKDFIIILKHAKRDEAMEKILKKLKVERVFSGVLTTGRYREKEVSIFRNGKVVIKGLWKRLEAEEIFRDLLA